MPTLKKRVNLTLSDEIMSIVHSLAKRDEMAVAGKASELLKIGIELEEDYYLGSLAASRDTKDATFVSLNEAL